jgi:hypothetical protein
MSYTQLLRMVFKYSFNILKEQLQEILILFCVQFETDARQFFYISFTVFKERLNTELSLSLPLHFFEFDPVLCPI